MALICNAKSKSTGEQCKQPASTGSTKCRYHGGKSLKGIASPNIKTGRYSKYLPTRMQERYEEARTDSELLALREDIALLDGRLADLLKRVDHGEAGQAWKEVRAAFTDLTVAMSTANGEKLLIATKELELVIGRGLSDYMAWDEISRLLEQRRKLSESERKRLVDMQNMVTGQEAQLLIDALLMSVLKNVPDRDVRNAIQTEFIRLTQRTSSQPVISSRSDE